VGASNGFDTDNYIYNVASSAKSKFGTGVFYIRYLNPSQGATHLITSSSGNSEFHTGWTYGVRYFAPNTEPVPQSRLNGTGAQGTADATAFCAALHSLWLSVLPLDIPTSGHLNCYLSLESATNLSTAYWNGWATYVDGYSLGGSLPLYPGMYCNPGSSAKNCSSAGAGVFCWSVWSSEHEPCSACGTFPEPWDAEVCYNSPGSVATSLVWQMAEEGVCKSCQHTTSWPNVDADMTNPSYTETGHMMYLAYQP
jgi:hypothetical protein